MEELVLRAAGFAAEYPNATTTAIGLVGVYILAGAVAGGFKGAGLPVPKVIVFVDGFVAALFGTLLSVPKKLFGKKG